MSDTATLSRLFASIEPDLERVDRLFEERAFSGLDMLNSAAEHARQLVRQAAAHRS